MNKERVMERVQEHKDFLVRECGFKEELILGVFLYGSQNYGFATDDSDVDTKAIVFPTLHDLSLGKPMVSKEYHLPNGEHCEVKDLREMVANYKKQNMNFIETLYTEFKWVNPLYKDYWERFFERFKEDFAHFDEWKTVYSAACQGAHRQSITPKRVHNAKRILTFLDLYTEGVPYKECMNLYLHDPELAEELRKIKFNLENYTQEELNVMYDKAVAKLETYVETYRNVSHTVNEKTLNILETSTNLLFRGYLRRALNNYWLK